MQATHQTNPEDNFTSTMMKSYLKARGNPNLKQKKIVNLAPNSSNKTKSEAAPMSSRPLTDSKLFLTTAKEITLYIPLLQRSREVGPLQYTTIEA